MHSIQQGDAFVMLQAVKSLFLSSKNPREESRAGSKRRYHETSFESLTPLHKRKRSEITHVAPTLSFFEKWNVGKIFKYITTGKTEVEEEMSTMHLHRRDCSVSQSACRINTKTRHILSATKRKDLARKPLLQISNAAVLDLTNIDSEELNNDSQAAPTVVDLTKTSDSTSSMNTTSLTLKNRVGSLARQKSVGVLKENVRLDERRRYKELLAQFTTTYLPEYSKSISPPSYAKQEGTTRTFFVQDNYFAKKAPLIDLTKEGKAAKPRRRFYHEILQESRSSSSILEYSRLEDISTTSNFSKSPTTYTQSTRSDALCTKDWITKWRNTLDPIQLERERQIREEERKKEALKKKQEEEIQKYEKKSEAVELVALTDDMLAVVNNALTQRSPNEVLVKGFNAEIRGSDIATLRNATWLNDEVVNFYFNLIKERSENNKDLPKVHVFNTFFYPKIMKVGHSGVKRWTRKVDIFSFDLLLIPVHLGMHWCLAVIDLKHKQIVYYDSLKGNNSPCIDALRNYLRAESLDKKKTEFDLSGWTEVMPKDIPEQMNGCDCGMFMCRYAEYKSRAAKFTFSQTHMPYFRKRTIYEILNKKLL